MTTDDLGRIHFVSRKGVMEFRSPVRIVTTADVSEVLACLHELECAVADGFYAAGFIAYEAALAFDATLVASPPSGAPLLWFGLYTDCHEGELPNATDAPVAEHVAWAPTIDKAEYSAAIDRIRAWIAAGDTYQVNYTYRLRADYRIDPLAHFRRLCRAQQADFCAFVNAGTHTILSASPELFFRLDGDRIETRPMKGTRPRGLTYDADCLAGQELANDPKERAENVMIVDLLRNDLGRIATPGTVAVESLFDVERYPTVWQMTSRITAQTHAGVPEILTALFPCGSVTGAPKRRTMELIRELEPHPRGVYCGTIGWWGPGRKAEFNVAIRTLTIDHETGVAEYGVGGGVTWDSTATAEFAECAAKAAFLAHTAPEFQLIESLRYDGTYWLLDEHLARLSESAAYFGFSCDAHELRERFAFYAVSLPVDGVQKVRLLLSRDGSVHLEHGAVPVALPVRLGWAAEPVDERNVFLYHKTTIRSVYEAAAALASRSDCDDALLYNRRGEITESTVANVALEVGDVWYTPPVSSGLLNGAFRRHLLVTGQLQERILLREDVAQATTIRLFNSVRGWIEVQGLGV